MKCSGTYGSLGVEFNQLTNEQICMLDWHLGCKVAPSLLKRVDPAIMNALRLVTVREEIEEKEIDLAVEILKRTSTSARVLFWSLFSRNEGNYPRSWFDARMIVISSKIFPLINNVNEYGPYASWGMRRSHPGACSAPSLLYGWHKTTTPLAISPTRGIGTGSFVDIISKTQLEHNAWDVTFHVGVTKNECHQSVNHRLIVFPCEFAGRF